MLAYWRQRYQGLRAPTTQIENHRRHENKIYQNQQENHSFKDAVILGIDGTKIPQRNFSNDRDSRAAVTTSVELNLKIILVAGPNGDWDVQWARVVDKPNSLKPQVNTDKGKAQVPLSHDPHGRKN